jgi:hypothetical protein
MKSKSPPKDKFKKSKEEMTFQEKLANHKNPKPSVPDFSKNDAISTIGKLGKK